MALKYSDVVAGLAFLVSLASAGISYQSLNSTEHQVRLSDVQIRPYVRYKPVFEQSGPDSLAVKMISENLSPIPAAVEWEELKVWVDGGTTGAFMYNRTADVLYEHHNGASDLPPMPRDTARAAIRGMAHIQIGTCVVYHSLSSSDQRRWQVRALYAYSPHNDLPSVDYLEEIDVANSVSRCDPSAIRDEWIQRRQPS